MALWIELSISRGQLAAGWYKRLRPATANLGTGLDTLRCRHATLTETFELAINGRTVAIDAPAEMPLLWVLRDLLGLTGTKFGCGIAKCGACTIHLDSAAVRS